MLIVQDSVDQEMWGIVIENNIASGLYQGIVLGWDGSDGGYAGPGRNVTIEGNTIDCSNYSRWADANVGVACIMSLQDLYNITIENNTLIAPSIPQCLILNEHAQNNVTVSNSTYNGHSFTGVWSLSDVGLAEGMTVDSSGNVYVAYNGLSQKTVRKINNKGYEIWSSSDVENADGIAVDSSGNVYVAYYNAAGTTNVRKFNSSGVQHGH